MIEDVRKLKTNEKVKITFGQLAGRIGYVAHTDYMFPNEAVAVKLSAKMPSFGWYVFKPEYLERVEQND